MAVNCNEPTALTRREKPENTACTNGGDTIFEKLSTFHPLAMKRNLFEKPSSYRAVNTLRLGYKNHSVNAV